METSERIVEMETVVNALMAQHHVAERVLIVLMAMQPDRAKLKIALEAAAAHNDAAIEDYGFRNGYSPRSASMLKEQAAAEWKRWTAMLS